MIQTYTWHVDMTGPDPESREQAAERIEQVGLRLVEKTSFMLGAGASVVADGLYVTIKVSGRDRWATQQHAKQLGEKLFKDARLWKYPIKHTGTDTMPNRRGMSDGQGRTPRPRPAKTQ